MIRVISREGIENRETLSRLRGRVPGEAGRVRAFTSSFTPLVSSLALGATLPFQRRDENASPGRAHFNFSPTTRTSPSGICL